MESAVIQLDLRMQLRHTVPAVASAIKARRGSMMMATYSYFSRENINFSETLFHNSISGCVSQSDLIDAPRF